MNCSEFWKMYEETGITHELEKHLSKCSSCLDEMLIEKQLEKTVQNIERFKAPEKVWDNIEKNLREEKIKYKAVRLLLNTIRSFFSGRLSLPGTIPLKPAVIGFALIVLTSVTATYYTTRIIFPTDKFRLQEKAVSELEKTEMKYIAAIEKFSRHIEDNKDSIDPELYDLYTEKLATLDEYILLCEEAVSENEYNINARTYLAMAYKEKVSTLKEMSQKI
ncbi:MAG: hypothetical protein HOC71_15545 [Candidatus Latescibacteria bacterium]|jgi:hypothetical protein|nr:hypothetical protein [Candidatus Latescibacterota bacterium]